MNTAVHQNTAYYNRSAYAFPVLWGFRDDIIRFTYHVICEVAFDELVDVNRPAYVLRRLTSS